MFGNIILAFVFLLGTFYVYFKRKFNYWKEKGVPHRKPTFPFGNLLGLVLYKECPAKYFADLYNEFEAPYVGFYAFSNPNLLIKDTELIKTVLIKDFDAFPNRSFFVDEKVDPIISNALIGIKVPRWNRLRKKLSFAFTSIKIKMMTQLMLDCGEQLENYIGNVLNQNIEMKEVAAKYTTDVITSCAFGIHANSFAEDSKFRYFGNLQFPTSSLQNYKAMSYIFAPQIVKIFKYPFIDERVTNFFRKVFNATLLDRDISKVKRNDLVDILNEIKNEEHSDDTFKFEGDRIFAQALVFFGAGHETTSSTISFTLHELSMNRAIQDKLREEVIRKIDKHGGLSYEAVHDMKYLDMVVSETLRKYPLTPILNRKSVVDYKFAETGLEIKKGTTVLISPHALHWDPRYFPQPERYDPERFSKDNKHTIPNYVYVPFGDGPRKCIAKRFGLLSSKLGIIHIIRKFRVETNSDTRHPIIFSRSPVLKSKYGIPLTCTKL